MGNITSLFTTKSSIVADTNNPVDETTPPVDETTPPVDETTPPVDETTKFPLITKWMIIINQLLKYGQMKE